jgi:hypothetical protein
MSKVKIAELSRDDIERMRAEAANGLRPRDLIPLQAQTDRGAVARAVRARQGRVAQRSSVDLIREERDAL